MPYRSSLSLPIGSASAKLAATAATTLTNGAWTKIVFGSISHSYGAGLAPSVANNNIVVSISGIYMVTGVVSFPTTATGRSVTGIYNGTEQARVEYGNSVGPITSICTTQMYLAAGATIDLRAYQNSGGAVSSAFSLYPHYLTVTRVA